MRSYQFNFPVIVGCLLVATMFAGCMTSANGSNVSSCESISFADGSKVFVRSDKIRAINAVLEWPAKQVSSVSIVLPSEPSLAKKKIESILVSPLAVENSIDQQELARFQAASCAELKMRKGVTRCKVVLPQPWVVVSVVFDVSFSDSLVVDTDRLAQYVAQQALNCPSQ